MKTKLKNDGYDFFRKHAGMIQLTRAEAKEMGIDRSKFNDTEELIDWFKANKPVKCKTCGEWKINECEKHGN